MKQKRGALCESAPRSDVNELQEPANQVREFGLATILSCSQVSGTMNSGLRKEPSSTLIQVNARKYEPSPIPIHRVPRMPFVSTPTPAVEGSRGILVARASTRERVRSGVGGVAVDVPVVLAVSGGADSMVMAQALWASSRHCVAAVATFDHGTGEAARAASEHVSDWAQQRGIPVRVGRATSLAPTEASWRAARWAFLRGVAGELGAAVATAHTLDDQAETVFMRLLRGSGVRGLAGILAPGPVLRPLLVFDRVTVREWATTQSVPFVEDPSNASLRHLRNRVRLELLPRLEQESPGFRDWLIGLGERAAAWRTAVAQAVDRDWAPAVDATDGMVRVPRDAKRLPGVEEAALFWPDVAGRIGVALDRRGTARLATFTTKLGSGHRMPLSGGAIVRSERLCWTLERAGASADV